MYWQLPSFRNAFHKSWNFPSAHFVLRQVGSTEAVPNSIETLLSVKWKIAGDSSCTYVIRTVFSIR